MLTIPNGVSCTMLVPYTADDHIDIPALDAMVDWYARKGCASIFAMCHSTEMHMLTMDERRAVVSAVRASVDKQAAKTGKKLPVLAAGTFSDDLHECLDSIHQIRDSGADAVVLITNRLDPRNEGALCRSLEWLLSRLPADLPLGMYECPHPYKRLLTTEELSWAAASGRIQFLKDTCCAPALLRERLQVTAGTPLRLFNANAQTLLYSLRLGAAGYSSVMANIHPQLYVWLCENWQRRPEAAEQLQEELCLASFTETLSYPLIAKYIMRQEGVPIEITSRVRARGEFTEYHRMIMDQLHAQTKRQEARLGVI